MLQATIVGVMDVYELIPKDHKRPCGLACWDKAGI